MIKVQYEWEFLSRISAVGALSLSLVGVDKRHRLTLIPTHVIDVLVFVFRVPNLFHVCGMIFFPLFWVFEWHCMHCSITAAL